MSLVDSSDEFSVAFVPSYDERIAWRVVCRMREQNLKVPDVAAAAGISQESLQVVRGGYCPLNARELYGLAAALGITIEQLIGG